VTGVTSDAFSTSRLDRTLKSSAERYCGWSPGAEASSSASAGLVGGFTCMNTSSVTRLGARPRQQGDRRYLARPRTTSPVTIRKLQTGPPWGPIEVPRGWIEPPTPGFSVRGSRVRLCAQESVAISARPNRRASVRLPRPPGLLSRMLSVLRSSFSGHVGTIGGGAGELASIDSGDAGRHLDRRALLRHELLVAVRQPTARTLG